MTQLREKTGVVSHIFVWFGMHCTWVQGAKLSKPDLVLNRGDCVSSISVAHCASGIMVGVCLRLPATMRKHCCSPRPFILSSRLSSSRPPSSFHHHRTSHAFLHFSKYPSFRPLEVMIHHINTTLVFRLVQHLRLIHVRFEWPTMS